LGAGQSERGIFGADHIRRRGGDRQGGLRVYVDDLVVAYDDDDQKKVKLRRRSGLDKPDVRGVLMKLSCHVCSTAGARSSMGVHTSLEAIHDR
jgi:hypothetical protein